MPGGAAEGRAARRHTDRDLRARPRRARQSPRLSDRRRRGRALFASSAATNSTSAIAPSCRRPISCCSSAAFRWSRGARHAHPPHPARRIKPGALVDGTPLIVADMGYQIDNMEGIAVHRTAARRNRADADLGRQFLGAAAHICCCSSRWWREGVTAIEPRGSRRAFFLTICPLELEHLGRELAVLGLEQEGVEPAAMIDASCSALAETRTRTERPSASEISVTLSRFGRNRRLVLMFEWLTLWPTSGLLPVRSQRRDMAHPSKYAGAMTAPVRSSRHGSRPDV